MDSGFGDDEAYNVYDKPWRSDKDAASHIYRPSRNKDRDTYGDDLDELIKTNRLDVFLKAKRLNVLLKTNKLLVDVQSLPRKVSWLSFYLTYLVTHVYLQNHTDFHGCCLHKTSW